MPTLTTEDITRGLTDERWDGHGYLGGRRAALDNSDPESPAQPERVAEVDALVIEHANQAGWTYDQLFDNFLNNKHGRWAADRLFDTDDAPLSDRIAYAVNQGYLPGKAPKVDLGHIWANDITDRIDLTGDGADLLLTFEAAPGVVAEWRLSATTIRDLRLKLQRFEKTRGR